MKNTLGTRISFLLSNKNLSQKEFAKLIGLNEVTVGRYINDKREPTASVLKIIAEALNVSTDYLLGKSSNPKLIPVKTSHNKFKELRKSNNYSQKDLSEILNISATAYGHYERGRTVPSTEMIITLSKFYNVTTDYLLGLNPNSQPIQEEEKDVYKKFEELKDSLENTDDLMFCGDILDDKTRELLLSSLKNTIIISNIIAKK